MTKTLKAIFAVLCEDTQYDFYLVKVNSESFTLNHDKTDSWGVRFNSNSNVIEGNYFQSIMRSDNGAFSSSASSVSELDVLAFTVCGMTLYVTNLSMKQLGCSIQLEF
jgi:hypothetical protein